MRKTNWLCKCILSVAGFMSIATAYATPGDSAAIENARKDYAAAMKSHDKGLQNAMRVQLATQISLAKERASRKDAAARPAKSESKSKA